MELRPLRLFKAGTQRVALCENGVLFYLLGDHLGSLNITANASGNQAGEKRYRAWGEERLPSGSSLRSMDAKKGAPDGARLFLHRLSSHILL